MTSLVFKIPGPLRELAGDRDEVRVESAAPAGSIGSVADALALLWQECPAVRDRVMTELGQVRPHVSLFVDGEDIRFAGGLETPVRDGSEIYILPALSGG